MSGFLMCCTVNQTGAHPWLVANGVESTIMRVPAHKKFDLLPRLCVPLWEGEAVRTHLAHRLASY